MKTFDTPKSYTFDVKLFATVTLKAENETQARVFLRDAMECADCNGGLWPDGIPILFEASADGESDLIEIDGEPTL